MTALWRDEGKSATLRTAFATSVPPARNYRKVTSVTLLVVTKQDDREGRELVVKFVFGVRVGPRLGM